MVDFSGKFEAIGFVNILTSSKLRPFYMYQEDNGVKRYIKVGDSSTDYRLSVTTVSLLKATIFKLPCIINVLFFHRTMMSEVRFWQSQGIQ